VLGKKIDDFDLLIAATALHLSYKLVTDNVRHFRNIPNLTVENWEG
jgi:predicted nucleic acid-binding protein